MHRKQETEQELKEIISSPRVKKVRASFVHMTEELEALQIKLFEQRLTQHGMFNITCL